MIKVDDTYDKEMDRLKELCYKIAKSKPNEKDFPGYDEKIKYAWEYLQGRDNRWINPRKNRLDGWLERNDIAKPHSVHRLDLLIERDLLVWVMDNFKGATHHLQPKDWVEYS